MRIFYSPDSDPMLLDTGAELNALHDRLKKFLASPDDEISIPAKVTKSPAPYDEFLKGLRVRKTQGLAVLRLFEDHWLELTGSEETLAKYLSHFYFQKPDEGGHHHPDIENHMARGSVRLIVEADSTWGDTTEG